MTASLGHVGLTVSELERSVRFYVEVAGMHEQLRHEMESEGFDRLTGNSGSRIRVAMLSAGDFTLQLVEYAAGGDTTLGLGHARVGSPHLSFWANDPVALRERLSRRGGVRITSEIVEIIPGMRSFYVVDPDGVPVEFIEGPPS